MPTKVRILYPWVVMLIAASIASAACAPTVQVAAPKEPITINLNVKIQHEIVVKVDKELDTLFSEEDKLF